MNKAVIDVLRLRYTMVKMVSEAAGRADGRVSEVVGRAVDW